MSAFEEFGVCPEIIRAIEEDGWLLPTPIQAEAIPNILGGRDVCAAAETGSGKTGAFGLPCIQIVHETLRDKMVAQKPTSSQAVHTTIAIDRLNKDARIECSADGKLVSCTAPSWMGVKYLPGIIGGKYHWECKIGSQGLVRLGVSAPAGLLDLAKDALGWGYGGTGKKSWNKRFDDFGPAFTKGDVVGIMLDRECDELVFSVNGQSVGTAFRIQHPKGQPLQPHVCGKGFHVEMEFENLRYPVNGFAPLKHIKAEHCHIADPTGGLDSGARKPCLLVLEPTRDLAMQTYECFQKFAKYLANPTPQIALLVGGGIDERKQSQKLASGVDIVIGTLPKVSERQGRGELDLSQLRFLVLDEADDLIKGDDRKLIPRLRRNAGVSARTRVQTLFFSATLHADYVKKAIEELTEEAVWCDLKGAPKVPDVVDAVVFRVDPKNPPSWAKEYSGPKPVVDGVHKNLGGATSDELISQKIKYLKPQIAVFIADKLKMASCLIFCRTNVDCDNFEAYLNTLGGGKAFKGKMETGVESRYSCVVLAGARSQQDRIRNLQHFKDGDVRFLICTDVAARGIDISALPFLIMMTMPHDLEQWVHRVGRVGRADCMGLAISLVATCREKVWYHTCGRKGGAGCTNTKLTDEGGCCTWLDELQFIKDLDNKFSIKLPEMDPETLSVPGILDVASSKEKTAGGVVPKTAGAQKRLRALGEQDGEARGTTIPAAPALTKYGQRQDDSKSRTLVERYRSVFRAAQSLTELETDLQVNYVTWAEKLSARV